jgi:hypothetical protein
VPGFGLKRLGTIRQPSAGDPFGVEPDLIRVAARGPGGTLYLFPHLAARGYVPRIGIAQGPREI